MYDLFCVVIFGSIVRLFLTLHSSPNKDSSTCNKHSLSNCRQKFSALSVELINFIPIPGDNIEM